ncbi:MAG TPA: amidohydrolase/deacetylase family metallohydrolase, partial [Bacteroidales bacterium]|nr:amidohydrolase/deacetylase family metallohydrolase [Bacteroidales bacterium]
MILVIFLIISSLSRAQTYNIVIKGGHVIDPKNNINEVMDIAVKDGKIAIVAKN